MPASTRPPWSELWSRWLRQIRPPEGQAPEPEDVLLALPSAAPLLSPSELAGWKEAYLQRLRGRANRLYFAGLDERRQDMQEQGRTLDLAAIYQPLNTAVQIKDDQAASAGVDVTSSVPVAASVPTRALTALEAVGREQQAVLLGGRGTGKTMLLRYLALAMAGGPSETMGTLLSRLQPAWRHGVLFPVWIDLREFRAACPACTAAELALYVAHDLGLDPLPFRDQLIAAGGVLFLIDNLDAAPHAAARFVHSLREAAARVPGVPANHVLLTGQSYVDVEALAPDTFADFGRIRLRPWTQEQMDSFVRGWYAELQRKEWIDAEAARDLPGQLIALLRRSEVRALAQRPGLMAVIALLHTMHGRLPARPVAFYQQLLDYALNAWGEGHQETEHDLRQMFAPADLRSAIAQVIYQGYTRLEEKDDLVPIPERDLKAVLFNLSQDGRRDAVNEFIYRVQTRSSLLDEPAAGVYTLIEPNLQAYVVSHGLAGQPDRARQIVHLAQEDFYHWRQPILLAVDQLVCLQRDVPAALEVIGALVLSGAASDRGVDKVNLWRRIWLAGEALVGLLQNTGPEAVAQMTVQIKKQLTCLLNQGYLAPRERAACGRVLDRLPGGDERPGVASPLPMWCPVPGGPFWQGEGETARLVDLPAFWITRYAVTNRQYLAFVRDTNYPAPGHWQDGRPPAGMGNHPVVMVTWEDARAYAAWWNQQWQDNRLLVWSPPGAPSTPVQASRQWQVRLPTSAEWEKSVRGGLSIPAAGGLVDNPLPRRAYPWGDTWTLSTVCCPGDETRCNVSESDIGTTTPVGMYPGGASPLGVLDAAGNVWEWCLDWVDREQHYKIRRGGAFRYTHEYARCAAVDRAHPDLVWPYVGFRLVLGPSVMG